MNWALLLTTTRNYKVLASANSYLEFFLSLASIAATWYLSGKTASYGTGKH